MKKNDMEAELAKTQKLLNTLDELQSKCSMILRHLAEDLVTPEARMQKAIDDLNQSIKEFSNKSPAQPPESTKVVYIADRIKELSNRPAATQTFKSRF